MVTVLINERKIRLPESWDEVTVDLYQRLLEWDQKDRLQLFSILTGESYTKIENTRDTTLENKLYALTNFLYAEPEFYYGEIPSVLKLSGKSIKIPKELGDLTFGQNIHVRQGIAGRKDARTGISLVCAIYLQPYFKGTDEPTKFDYLEATVIESEILNMPIKHFYAIGCFFLGKLQTSGGSSWKAFARRIRQKLRNARQLVNWPKLKSSIDSLKFPSSIHTVRNTA